MSTRERRPEEAQNNDAETQQTNPARDQVDSLR